MKKKNLPLTHALSWIVGSALLVNGTSYSALKYYLKNHRQNAAAANFAIRSIIQTGPQKEALKTEYLAELLSLSSDRPCNANSFNLKLAEERLLSSPLISRAEVKLIKPSTLYVDYTIRQPIAYLEDYANVACDKEGYLFPFTPFYTPKRLPAIYLGLAPFGQPPYDPDKEKAEWNAPLKGKYFTLALGVLNIVTDPKVEDLFSVKRIDVSNAFAESYGTREIVVITEDVISSRIGGKEMQLIVPRILRLSTKNYAQELGNYLKLRQQLLDEEKRITTLPEHTGNICRLKEKIIDFRIQQLAFIESGNKI